MWRFAFLLFLCRCLSAQQTSFAGVAINAITRQPLAGVHITIYAPVRAGSASQSYGATSGRDGRFSMPAVNPGGYALLVRHNGFVYLQDLRVSLKAGDAVTDHTVEMTPEAVVSGRVVDDYGDPVERASVRASAVGRDSSMSAVLGRMYSITDERGQFRIVGAPGKFHVGVAAFRAVGVHEVRTDGSEIPVYAETWYPGSESDAIFSSQSVTTKADGAYSFAKVQPGSYKLLAVPEDDADLVLQGYGLTEYNDVMSGVEINAGDKNPLDLGLRRTADK